MKRAAEKQLSKDDHSDGEAQDDAPQVGFQKADQSDLVTRQIRALPKRASVAALLTTQTSSSNFSGFNGGSSSFSGYDTGVSTAEAAPTPVQSDTAKSLSSLSSNSAEKSTNSAEKSPNSFDSSSPLAASSTTSLTASSPPASTKKDAELDYLKNLRGLNESLRSAMSEFIDSDPFVDLREVFDQYRDYRVKIQEDFDNKVSPPSLPSTTAPAPSVTIVNKLPTQAPPSEELSSDEVEAPTSTDTKPLATSSSGSAFDTQSKTNKSDGSSSSLPFSPVSDPVNTTISSPVPTASVVSGFGTKQHETPKGFTLAIEAQALPTKDSTPAYQTAVPSVFGTQQNETFKGSTPASAPAFSGFGTKQHETSRGFISAPQAPALSVFGTKQHEISKDFTPASQTAAPSVFGTPASWTAASPAFGTPASQTPVPSGFGAPASWTAAPSAFGTPASQTAVPSAFGAITSQTPAPSGFGAIASQTPAPSVFGTPTSQIPASSGFGVLASRTAAPSVFGTPASQTLGPSGFGASASRTAAPSGFGTPASQTPASSGFGAPASRTPAPSGSGASASWTAAPSIFGTKQHEVSQAQAFPVFGTKQHETSKDYIPASKTSAFSSFGTKQYETSKDSSSASSTLNLPSKETDSKTSPFVPLALTGSTKPETEPTSAFSPRTFGSGFSSSFNVTALLPPKGSSVPAPENKFAGFTGFGSLSKSATTPAASLAFKPSVMTPITSFSPNFAKTPSTLTNTASDSSTNNYITGTAAAIKPAGANAETPGLVLRTTTAESFIIDADNRHDREGAGEEDEETVYSAKLKAYVMKDGEAGKSWVELGYGVLRVKKHKESKIKRVLLRSSSTGQILINFNFHSAFKPVQKGKNVTFLGHSAEGTSKMFTVKLRTQEQAAEFAAALNREIQGGNAPSALS